MNNSRAIKFTLRLDLCNHWLCWKWKKLTSGAKWQPNADGTAAYYKRDGTVYDTGVNNLYQTWCVQEISKLWCLWRAKLCEQNHFYSDLCCELCILTFEFFDKTLGSYKIEIKKIFRSRASGRKTNFRVIRSTRFDLIDSLYRFKQDIKN